MRECPDARPAARVHHPGMYHLHHMSGWGEALMVLWSAIWIAFLGLVAWAIVQWSRREPAGPRTARQLLDERLASGEIDVDEYKRLRAALR